MFKKILNKIKFYNKIDHNIDQRGTEQTTSEYGMLPENFKEGFCKFKGFHPTKSSVCFARTHREDNDSKKLILCAQLPNYTLTSITNDIESIAQRFSTNSQDIKLIEYYAPGRSVNPKGTYAFVEFEHNFKSPNWIFMPREEIIALTKKEFPKLPDNFFELPNNLENWREQESEWN